MDWNKLKKEYISGNESYRQLSEKYGVSHSQIMKRGAAEKWNDLKKKKGRIAEEKMVEKAAENESKIEDSVFEAAMLLLKAYTKSVEVMSEADALPPSMLKDYGSALKSIQAVLDKPTELDIQEQKARIEKLRRDTKEEDASKDVEIRISGWDESWAK